MLYERKKAGGCAPLSQWTTSHGTLSPYSSYGHDAAKMPKLLQPLILFLQILQFWGNAEDFGKRKVGLQGWLDLSRRKINNFLSIFGIFTSYTIQSTLSPVPRTVLRYTLGRLRSSFTVTGLHRPNELMIFPSTVGGAEAVRAMKGAFVRALRPPILSKAVQN